MKYCGKYAIRPLAFKKITSLERAQKTVLRNTNYVIYRRNLKFTTVAPQTKMKMLTARNSAATNAYNNSQ